MIELPDSYYIAAGLCTLLLIVAVASAGRPWALPFGTVVATVGIWYLPEPFYFPNLFAQFRFRSVQTAYDSVSIFYIALLIFAPLVSMRLKPKGRARRRDMTKRSFSADNLVLMVVCTWLALLAFGTYRMQGDLFGALFPVGMRSGARMWSRAAGAGAGADGFIVSAASYVYVLCLATFGVLLFFVGKKSTRTLLIFLILISWPYAFLQGSRNIVLATVVPAGLAFLMFAPVSRFAKFAVTAGGLVALDVAMRVIIAVRNTGLSTINLSEIEETSHLGLNMASELVYITRFLEDGTLSLTYGMRYLEEFANVIPRAIWPEKPLIGLQYTLARGFADYTGTSDIGVFATISSGMIGQGVLNFGNICGPIAAAILMSYWIGFLARLRVQGTPLRLALFLVGIGLTFNLGRDISLLVLWPMIFGYIGIRIFEYRESRRFERLSMVPHRGRVMGRAK